jgi:YHS domain-containing protein
MSMPDNPSAPAGKAVAASGGASAIKAPGEARVGERTTCAMHSDAVFTVTAATPKVEYRGRTYYFCCPECAKHFAERPGDFVK